MENRKLQETIQNIKNASEKKEKLSSEYEEAVNNFGEHAGIARVLNSNLEKNNKNIEELKRYTDELVNEKNKIETEIKELEEIRIKAKKDGRDMISLIEKDEKNNVSKTDKIQKNRMKKARELGNKVLELDNKISEKSNLLKEITDSLEILGYKEPKKQIDENEEKKIELIENDDKKESKKIETLEQKTVRVGNEALEDIKHNYKGTHFEADSLDGNFINKKRGYELGLNDNEETKDTESNNKDFIKTPIYNAVDNQENNKQELEKDDTRKEGIWNKIKSFKIFKQIKSIFEYAKKGIEGLTGKNKLISAAKKVDIQKEEKENEFKDRLKINFRNGNIEKNANEKINSRNVIKKNGRSSK